MNNSKMTDDIQALVADFHCHTVASTHAYSTITELAATAAKRGLKAIACTDHGIGIPDAPHLWHFLNMRILPTHIEGVRIFRGVEANVVDAAGNLDMPEEALDRMEIVVASMHGGVMPEGECTDAWLAIADNPRVDIIGHSGSPKYPYDYKKVIPVFGEKGKVVEINENTFTVRQNYVANCRRIAEICKKYGVRVIVDSDAHYHDQLGRGSRSLDMLREIGFPPALIVNGSEENLQAYLKEKGLTL